MRVFNANSTALTTTAAQSNPFFMMTQMAIAYATAQPNTTAVTVSYKEDNIPQYGFGDNHPINLFTPELWSALTVIVYKQLLSKGLIKTLANGELEAHIPDSIYDLQTAKSFLSKMWNGISNAASTLASKITGATASATSLQGSKAEILEYITEWLKGSSVLEEGFFKSFCRSIKDDPQLDEVLENSNDSDTSLLLETARNNSLPRTFATPDCPYSITIGKGPSNLCNGHPFFCIEGRLNNGTQLIAEASRFVFSIPGGKPSLSLEHGLTHCFPGEKLLDIVCQTLPAAGFNKQSCPLSASSSYGGASYAGQLVMYATDGAATNCLGEQNAVDAEFVSCLNWKAAANGFIDGFVKIGLPIYGGVAFLMGCGTFCFLQNDQDRSSYDSMDGSASACGIFAKNAAIATAAGVFWPVECAVIACAATFNK